MRKLVEQYVFGPEKNRAEIYDNVKNKALKKGIFLASTALLYKEIAKGNAEGFSVPAFNIRTITFDSACAVFKAAKKTKTKAFILEIAKSEMEYTKQTPQEFAFCCLGAALEEKYKGPIFLQGDHFCLKDQKESSAKELEDLILKSIQAGFFNIDIDCSDMDFQENLKNTVRFSRFIKNNQPFGIEMTIGGETNAIGGEATTLCELERYLKEHPGVNKVSCQTGTNHGGNVLASGERAEVFLDYNNIKELGKTARNYGLAGIVQHGASTLKDEQFNLLRQADILEIHLSTIFSDIILDSLSFPRDLGEKINFWTKQNFAIEKSDFQSEIQFEKIYRKKSLGVFKREIWKMPFKNIKGIREELEKKFSFFFSVLGVRDSENLIKKIYY